MGRHRPRRWRWRAFLADGRSIQYLVDGADRRVAKLIGGELQWLFVYSGGLPVARFFPDGSVESIYVYGALEHVPDVILKAGRTYRIIHDHLGSPVSSSMSRPARSSSASTTTSTAASSSTRV